MKQIMNCNIRVYLLNSTHIISFFFAGWQKKEINIFNYKLKNFLIYIMTIFQIIFLIIGECRVFHVINVKVLSSEEFQVSKGARHPWEMNATNIECFT